MTDQQAAAEPIAPQPSSMYRWVVLVVISLAMFANYYVYDSIAPIADLLKSELGITDANYGMLFSVYSLAAVIVLLLGGVVIDKYGTVKSTIVFGAICTFAGILMVMTSNFWVMVGARFLLGLGSEPLIVAITCALAKWFKGRELGFAFGINLTIARLGSFSADWMPTWVPSAFVGWRGPLIIAAAIGTLVVVSAVAYGALEARASRRYGLGNAGETDKLVLSDLFRFHQVVLVCGGTLRDLLLRDLPVPGLLHQVLYGSVGVDPRNCGSIQQCAPAGCHVRHASLRASCRQGWETGAVYGLWFVPDDAGLSDDGLSSDAVVGADRHDGDRVFIDSRGDVALGCLHR